MKTNWFIRRAAALAGVSALAVATSIVTTTSATAACPPEVTPGESPAGPQTIGSGSECTVEQGASIATTGDDEDGIQAVDGNMIVNRGTITTTGTDARGIFAEEGNSIVNYGLVSTTGAAPGIEVYDGNSITNHGTVSTAYQYREAILGEDDNTIVNHGTVSTTGSDGVAIQVNHDNIVTNNGLVQTTGDDAFGIDVGSGNVITNSGTIRVTGIGIDASYDNTIINSGLIEITAIRTAVDVYDGNTITNTGTIRTTDNYSWGVAADDDNIINNSGLIATVGASSDAVTVHSGNTITNSGAIVADGPRSAAVSLVQGNNTLNLLQGSRIVGLIEFRETRPEEEEENEYADNSVTLGRGENWLMTFNEDPRLSNSLDTSGAPTAFLNGGLTVATFDVGTTVFGAEADALSDLTNTINATLHHRLTAGNPTTYLWAQGFGAKRNGEDENALAGGMAGFSAPLSSFARGGLFAGYVDGSIESGPAGSVGDNSQRHVIDQQSWFAGAYGRAFWGQAFADVIVTAGETDNDSTRRILNNLALNGVEFAQGSYDGWFVNPELTLGIELPFATNSLLVPSASIGYAGLFLDGLDETGSLASVSLDARDVELIDGRLQLELRTKGETSTGPWQTAVRAGIKGRSNIGDDTLFGVLAVTTAFDVALESGDDAIAGFVGGDLTFSVGPASQIFGGGEMALEDSGDALFTGRAGWAMKF